MITIITIVHFESDFEGLKRNLASLEPDWKLGLNLLCLATNEKIFLECRNFLKENIDRGECLVVYEKKAEVEGFKAANGYLNDEGWVLLLDNAWVLPEGTLEKLYKQTLEIRGPGFISAVAGINENMFLWVKDIYDIPDFIGANINELSGMVPIDIAAPRGLLTQTKLFKEVFCTGGIDGAGEFSYGIKLRRQGYQNYLNTEVKMRRANSEDYNAERASCEWEKFMGTRES